jgi:plasmid stabilization system protein ParE
MEALFKAVATRLARFPESGRLGRINGTRELVAHKNYTLVYKIQKDSIDVVAGLHASQFWPPPSE